MKVKSLFERSRLPLSKLPGLNKARSRKEARDQEVILTMEGRMGLVYVFKNGRISEVIMGSGPKDAYERECEIEEAKQKERDKKESGSQWLIDGSSPEVMVLMISHGLRHENAKALAAINLKTERKIKRIVVHAAETYPDMDIGAEWIRNIHVNENKWRDIGYHLVIRRNGLPEVGRPIHQVGAHTLGFNNDSIGICLVGGKARSGKSASNYTFDELRTLHATLTLLTEAYPDAEVCGHHDLAPGRGCPLIDVKSFWYGE